MTWDEVLTTVEKWAAFLVEPAAALRAAAADVCTQGQVGYYLNAETGRAGLFAAEGEPADLARCKAAAIHARFDPLFFSHQDLVDSPWVKVAYSPTLHRAGELLNFFPGQYPGGIPNSPSPLAAALTSGVLGAGLGYAGGRLAAAAMPRGVGRKLPRTGAVTGAAAGVAMPALWAILNQVHGAPLNDPGALGGLSNEELAPMAKNGLDAFLEAAEAFYEPLPEKTAAYGSDVDVDALGRTLWESGADPALAATTLGAVYAASRLPDPYGRPGIATGHQLGQLAMRTAGDYAEGYLAGAVLNVVIGTPFSAGTYGLGNAALGAIEAVVPKLLGSR